MKSPNCILVLLATLFLTVFSLAQQLTGTIAGTVTDSSGAVVAGVKVRAVNTATNLSVTAETAKDGSYQLSNLPIGTYTITFALEGFKTEERKEIPVQGNRTTTVAGSLEPGAVSTTVEVTGTPML